MNAESNRIQKIFVAIVSCGTKNDKFLAQLVREYRSMSFQVDITILSNVSKPVPAGVKLFVVDLRGKSLAFLPFPHKELFADRVDAYDLFVYSEDDTLISERNIRAFWNACEILPKNEIAGFLRYERGAGDQLNFPEVHGHFHWDSSSIRRRDDQVFANFTNEHSACYALTRDQLRAAINSGGFLVGPHRGTYDPICSAATDPYTQCGFQKVISISSFRDFLVHHLPNTYINSKFGVREPEMRRQVEKLLQLGQNGHVPSPLLRTASRLRDGRFSKLCYEPVQSEVVSRIPQGTRRVLSLGTGLANTEAELVKSGMRVVAVPVDPVFAAAANANGIDTVEGDFESAAAKLAGERFDCLLVLDILHLVRNPAEVLSLFTPLLASGASVIVQVPRVVRVTTLLRVLRGDQPFRELRGFDQTGVHFTSPGVLRKWIQRAGLEMRGVATLLPASPKMPPALRSILKPALATKMGSKMIVVAQKPSID